MIKKKILSYIIAGIVVAGGSGFAYNANKFKQPEIVDTYNNDTENEVSEDDSTLNDEASETLSSNEDDNDAINNQNDTNVNGQADGNLEDNKKEGNTQDETRVNNQSDTSTLKVQSTNKPSNNSTGNSSNSKPSGNTVGNNTNSNNNNISNNSSQNDSFMSQVEQLIYNKVNEERSKNGVSTLAYSSTMEKYARIKSKDMGDNNYFDHKDLNGNYITTNMKNDGVTYSAWAENIAYIGGVTDANALANQFMTNWMNSDGHRKNILSSSYASIGVGVYKIGNKVYATQEFYR